MIADSLSAGNAGRKATLASPHDIIAKAGGAPDSADRIAWVRKLPHDIIAKAGGAPDSADRIAWVRKLRGSKIQRSILTDAAVAGALSVDRPTMPTKPASDLTRTEAHFHQAA
jgi:hypothetical protein